MASCLGDDTEVGIGEPVGMDTLEEPPEWRGVGHIEWRFLTRPTSKYDTNTAAHIGND